jgi:UDP-N-acetylmuramate--alanine ligase
VAGTSGKSSVSAMIFHALKGCGKSPSLITGANLNELISRGMVGNAYHGDSDLLVIEADESDGSLVRYSPALSVFLNVSKDHKPVPEVIEMFKTLAMQSSQSVVNDDVPEFEQLRRTATFGASSSVTYRASALQAFCDTAAVTVDGTWYTMSQPGMHNAWNLLATVASCLQLRCRPEDLSKVIPGYGGIQRRFDLRRTRNDVIVIDDYAHNPDKIHAAVTTAHMLAERLFVLFQPHGFGPTRFMREELVGVFRDVLKKQDRLYLLPIYYAGGTADRSISSADLANDLSDSPATILAPDDRDEALREIAEKAKAGDAVLSMGARDPSLASFARRIAEAIDERG